jgi:hypothetical protein
MSSRLHRNDPNKQPSWTESRFREALLTLFDRRVEERRFDVSREPIERVMDKAPNDEWKLLIALGRYGDLGIPSEEVGLKISDVDLERNRITIASPSLAVLSGSSMMFQSV